MNYSKKFKVNPDGRLEVQNLFHLKNVKKNNVLDIIELTIPKGKMTCIIGESGSGKTTILKLLNGFESCDEGEIFVDGVPISDLDLIELRRNAVMLQQNPPIFTGNIRENLLIGLQFSEKPIVSDEILRSTLKSVRLRKELDQDTESLSGGEKQRLALARVIVMNSGILLLDEPTSALDDDTTQVVIDLLAELVKKQRKTVIVVTHAKALFQSVADHMIELHNGHLVRVGGVSD